MHDMFNLATASDVGEVVIYDTDDYQVLSEESIFLDGFDGELTTEQLLYSIDSKLTQINAYVTFAVTIGFASIIVYIILKPVFYFLDI